MEIHLERSFLCPRYLFIFVFALFSFFFFVHAFCRGYNNSLRYLDGRRDRICFSRVSRSFSVLLYEIFLAIFFSPRLDKVKGVKNLSAAVTLIVPV